ncbi:MAG TPA: hypothetical protein VKV02_06825 [Acidobacteriaceae bacterium]|nr:hypothetical protein [Acidobacteriaceae bacterium]
MKRKFGTPRVSPWALSGLLAAAALVPFANAATPPAPPPNFGPNVTVITPDMSSSAIISTLTALSNETQFSTNRHSVLFMPGTYTNIEAPVGYYEQIAGLGMLPGGVNLSGYLTPNFGTPVYGTPTWPQANLTDTFWRSLENMTITPVTDTLQNAPANTLQWGVSQGSPLRHLQINGSLELTNSYCGNSSGGFIADSVITGNVNSCSQQQWYSRGSNFGSWTGSVWNMVFSGVVGAPAQSYPNPPYTTLPTTPVSREKPFLYVDGNGQFNVYSAPAQKNASGVSWAGGKLTAGRAIPISKFFIASPSSTVTEINDALATGQNLLLTPGVYQLSGPIQVGNANTVVLGLGYATLVPQNGTPAIEVADVSGVQIAGLIIDAGPVNSPVLLQMGVGAFGAPLPVGGAANHAGNPSVISDITFRIAGATAGLATSALEVDSSDVILDDIWAWRADHGNGVGWTVNTAAHGLVVNGDRVIATGLAVEHFQQEQTLWNGNNGVDIFYQSELPYDPPSQAAWMDGSANGYPSYVVSEGVPKHTAYGLGIYSYFNQGINIVEDNAMTVPYTKGVNIYDAGTVWLNGSGQITHVINGDGAAVNSGFADKLSPVTVYP